MKPPVNTKKLTTLSLLSAIALALYAVESALPPIVPIPGIKLGLANIITLVVLWKYSARDAFFVLLVRILLASLFFGQAISLLYSLSGGLLCLLAMVFVQRLLHGHYLFLASMTGAVFHNLGQIGVAFLLTSVPVLRFVSFRKIHRKLRQHLCYGLVRNGMTEIRCQLTQRLQYKITILHIYMRNH